MSDDEKTRPAQRSVRRKPAIADVATRKVAAVKRRAAPPPGVEERLAGASRVLLLRRGELTNAAGERDNGWVVRDDLEGAECLRFVLSAEPLLKSLARALWKADDFFLDVMDGGVARGALVLDAVTPKTGVGTRAPPTEGSGQLLDEAGEPRASFIIRHTGEVGCFVGDERALEVLALRSQRLVKARGMAIARATPVMSDGVLPRLLHVDVELERSASPFERLCAVAALALSDAWEMERGRYRTEVAFKRRF